VSVAPGIRRRSGTRGASVQVRDCSVLSMETFLVCLAA
jgi:hypothetical protein